MSTVITSIDRRSPAERAGVRTGEKLISIGGHPVEDVLDYRFFGYDGDPELVLESPAGRRRALRVPKEEGDDLGLNFDTYLMDEPRPCSNFCLFCFVDQMAPGCRETLYFKDDDARLSFLMGNYITLPNLSDREAPSTSPFTPRTLSSAVPFWATSARTRAWSSCAALDRPASS